MLVYIYRKTNLVNGKMYVGQTIDIPTRMSSHKYQPTNPHIRHATIKYGTEVFFTKIVEAVEENEANERERFWITHYNTTNPNFGYNKTAGGSERCGYTEETRKKISNSCKGRVPWNKGKTGVYAQKTIEKMRQSALKRERDPLSKEMRQRISNLHKGKPKPRSEEHQRKITEAIRQKYIDDPTYSKRISESNKERIPWNKGKPRSEETKRKIRETKRRKRMEMEQ